MSLGLAHVRYGLLRHVDVVEVPRDLDLVRGADCVVESPRGRELARVLLRTSEGAPSARVRWVRLATSDDLAHSQATRATLRADGLRTLHKQLERFQAHPIGAEHLLDQGPLVVYYQAHTRVDIPSATAELEKHWELPVRLEQVGARQRACACGGAGKCGRALCCATFLRVLEPVSLRVAQAQGLNLNPEATAGACGRLKCCLRYERPHYESRGRNLPSRGWEVETQALSGHVLAVDILRRQVLLRTEDGARVRVFAEAITAQRPPRKTPLPRAGEGPQPTPPSSDEPPPDTGWSQVARRLLSRIVPRPKN